MPIYEWHCGPCEHTFEALVAPSAARRRRACPRCSKAAPRVVSAVALHVGSSSATDEKPRASSRPDVTALRVPPAARLCWMDDRSASRFAAYKYGRGAEYDDTVAARAESKRKAGIPEAPKVHAHHSHAHSPLADPGVRARRAAAAKRSAGDKATP